jgi:hypothetical protein
MNQVHLVPNADEPTWQYGDIFNVCMPTNGWTLYILAKIDSYVYVFVNLATGGWLDETVEIPYKAQGGIYEHMKHQLADYEYEHLGPCRIDVRRDPRPELRT